MQNPGTPQIPTIKYGDILNRASYSTFWDLQRLLQSISDKDPELRTVALRKYVMATRKRFIQQLALTRWLSTANIIQFNTALDQFHLNMNELLNTIEMSTYEVYCLHSQLYSMRTLKYEAELACSILGSGSYPSLPTSVTRGGVRGFPKIIPTDELLDRLNLSIRSKIALRQPLPRQYSYLSFQLKEGRLIIHNHYYYELVVMLEDLSIDSCWKIVSFQMEQKSIQGKLLLKDHQLSNKSNNNTQTEKVIKEHHSTRKKHLENYLFQKLLKENNVKESLLLMISLCDRSSMNFRLREVYIHWLQFIRKSLLKSYVDVKLIEIVDEHRIQIFFWKSIASDNMNTLNPIFQVVIELYVSQVEDEEIKVNQRLPTIAADILIPSTSKTVKGLEKEIPLHDLIGSFTSPERLYLTFAAYFSEKKLGFLYHRILSSISSPSAQGTLLENVVVVLKQHHLVFYPRSAKISEEEEAKLYVTVRVDARRGRFIVEAVDFTRLLSSCRTNLIRFEDEINDLQNENWFLRYLYDEHIQRDNYEEHNKVEGNNGATELLSYSTSFSTLDMIIEGMETIIQCNRYPVFSSSSSSIEYAADDERTQLQALTNYTTNTLIVWKAKYWYTKNIYQQKYQIVMNEMNKLEGDIKKRVSSLSTSLPSATSQPPSSLPEPSTTVKKAPFRPPPSDDNILSKKKVPSKQLQAQVSSKKDELAKEMYALYLVTTLAPQSSVPVNPPIFESNSVNSSSQTYLLCSLNYDFYLCKTEASLPSASGKTSKMKMTLIDRRLHQIDKTLQSLDLNDPEALERIIVDYEASWILKKFKVDYLPLTISIRPELLLSSETLPTHLSHLQVKLNEKSQNYQCLNSNNELLSLYNFQDNSFLITFFLPRSYQQILGVKDFDDENPLQERLPFASIIIDVFQIVNPSKVKENIHVRLLINSLSLQMKSLEASNITQLTTSQSSDNGKDVNPVTVANYSHHWTMYCTLEEKIQIHILQFLELLLKKAPLKAEMEYSTLTCVEAIRAVILTLWMLLIYGQIEKEETYDMIQKYDVQYALRPLTVTISPQDLPVILFAVDRITVNGNGKGGKSVAAELHFFRYFSFSFYDHSVVFLDTNYNRTNTFPLKEITPDNIPNMINQLQ